MVSADPLEVLLIETASERSPVLTVRAVFLEGAGIAGGSISSILFRPFGVAVLFQTQEGSIWARIAHGMRNEMYILSEMALDRSSLHPWFLHRSGTSTISPASKRCDQDGLCSRFTLHSLLAVISLRIPWAVARPSHTPSTSGR